MDRKAIENEMPCVFLSLQIFVTHENLPRLVWIMLLVVLTVGSFAVVLTQMVTEHKVTREREAPGQEISWSLVRF